MRRSAFLAVLAGFAFTACETPTSAPAALAPIDIAASSAVAGLTAPVGLADGALIADFDPTVGSRAINPGDYVCSSTPLFDAFNAEFDAWVAGEFDVIFDLVVNFFADQVPFLEIRFLNPTDFVFGYEGDYTNLLSRTDRAARRFWDIDSDRIQLVAMKGSMLTDVDRVAATYVAVGNPPAVSQAAAEIVRDLVQGSAFANGGNHPLFSFNAFAIQYADGSGKVAMGDGIIEGYAEMGFGDVAAAAIYGHEFAHHIQFQNGYFNDPFPTAAERTRYTELMADAMSAYFMTHKRGMSFNRHRVAQFLEAFFNIGDCGFTSSGHHGTPNQRMRAAQFGFDIANGAHKQGHILSSQAFYELFVAEYPNIIAPDAI